MANTATNVQKTPLGVGSIVSDSFSILFGNFAKVLFLGFVCAFVSMAVEVSVLGLDAATGTADQNSIDATEQNGFATLLAFLVTFASYGLAAALINQLAYDAKLGRSNSVGKYFNVALPAIFPIVVLTLVISLLCVLGLIGLVIGALWVFAVFYVTVPVIVIEKGGFGSMKRSAALTKDYRWPIVGLFLLVSIIGSLILLVPGFIIGFVALLGSGAFAQLVLLFGIPVIQGLSYAYGGIVVALVYARLREIKEGVPMDEIASVFD